MSMIASKSAKSFPMILKNASTSSCISGSYWKGDYADIPVVSDMSTGYFNAKSVCQLKNKKIEDWLSLEQTIELLEATADTIRELDPECTDPIVQYVVDQESIEELNGIYLHPLLFILLLQWVSIAFMCQVSDAMLGIAAREAREAREAKEVKKPKETKRKNKKSKSRSD